jgi:SAM-dependent methyltransferase
MENSLTDNIEWFEEWFDSKYYHILYKNRDEKEAQKFITNLIAYFSPKKEACFVDVACGKGRHSLFLNKLGFSVDGFDLSENSIENAKNFENENLHFFVNDIRKPLKTNTYDYAFNLFTSFGYFKDENDNQLAINSIAESIKKNGTIVLDFMNCNKVIRQLNKVETKKIDTIEFNITREVDKGFIVKNINFSDHNNSFHFQERVKAISLSMFKSYFNAANLKIEAIFGDYNLNSFDEEKSDRLILVAKKI